MRRMTQGPQVLASYSETGGATKTTVAVSLAVAYAIEHPTEEALLIDLDPRHAATKWTAGWPAEAWQHVGAILGNKDVDGWADDLSVRLDPEAGWPTNLRFVPSARTVANQEKTPEDHADIRLKRSLIGTTASFVVLDCPNRQGGVITQNALNAATRIVYAAKPDEDGLDGVDGAKETVQKFREYRQSIGAPVDLPQEMGIALGAAYKGAVWTRDALRAVEEFERTSPGMLLTPYVQDLVIVKESRSGGVFYGKYAAGKPVLDAYRELLRKVLS